MEQEQQEEISSAQKRLGDALWAFIGHYHLNYLVYDPDRNKIREALNPLLAPWGCKIDDDKYAFNFETEEAQLAFILAWH